MINQELLALLVCPVDQKSPLRIEADALVCTRCGARYAIKNGIPNMLIEEAELPAGCASLNDLECAKPGDAKAEAAGA
ncbi:Trm112 family protein [Singulisphaera sp. PoT]|uniref:Trm112 family protein n=1 Tax=Singulisphaera sp. PoT TaxID=3411797 RepID=UPI003BF50F19